MEQRRRKQDLLPHALRIRREGIVAVVPKGEEVEELVHSGFEDPPRHPAQPARELEILATGGMRIKVRLLGHVADAPLEGREIVINAVAVVENAALRRLD